MKKRILALALAGTTAFSVFGGAMSANAAWWDSSHVNANDDAYYKHYTPAGDIRATSDEISANKMPIDCNFYVVANPTSGKVFPEGTSIYVTPEIYKEMQEAQKTNPSSYPILSYVTNMADKDSGVDYYANEAEFAEKNGYVFVTADGAASDTQPDTFKYKGDTYMLVRDDTTDLTEDVVYAVKGSTLAESGYNEGFAKIDKAGSYYVPVDALEDHVGDETASFRIRYAEGTIVDEIVGNNHYYIAGKTNNGTDLIYNDWDDNYTLTTKKASQSYKVTTDAGYTALDPTSPNYEAVMANPVEASGEVYGYDYYEQLPYGASTSEFNRAWGLNQLEKFFDENGINVLVPEDGYTREGLRGDVIYAWEDFLDEIGLYNGTGTVVDDDYKVDWAERMINNYAYTYYDDDVIVEVDTDLYDDVVVYYVASKNVDVYNFAELIKDIVNTADRSDIAEAQTSEMVYLMQQYNKYMDGYVDEMPVETDDWGDLLVSLLEAPTEDDFRTANSYKRFVDKAEDLIEDYQEAYTYLDVQAAEQAMYKFITGGDGWNGMDDNRSEDTSALAAAIDSATFNYNWQRSYGDNSAGVYVGTIDTDGILNANYVDSDLGAQVKNAMKWTPQAWALYPQDDYIVYDKSVYKYPGVEGGVSNVDATYGWFVNVYELAYDVYVGNDFQGTLDVMAEALNEAIAALTPTENAKASDVLGAEEASEDLADLVETDYTADMWDNRDKVYNFITERVSNDEIGETGTNNAEDIAELMAIHLGYQRNQTTVTRTDINAVKTAKTEAEAALKALRDDEDNYNAAQANALEKAIDDCQYLIDLYEGDYSLSSISQSVNTAYNGAVGDKDQILKSDCDDAVAAVDAAINFAGIIMGWSQDKDDNWMYGTEEGYLNDGWHQVDGGKTWFYFNEDGTAKQSEWWQDGSTWYWFNSNCGAAVGWAKIDGDWYYFKGNNAMKTGWEKVEGSWYYMNSSGKMVTGWCQINGTWYYFSKESNALGQMLANTTTPDGYKVDANGALVE